MKLLGREISHRTSLILGILVLFALTAAGFGVYGLVSSESTGSDEAQNQLQRTGVLVNPEQAAFPAPKPEGPALSSEDIPETVSLPDSPVIDIALGLSHTCALHIDTSVSCWGSNQNGQIGAAINSRTIDTPVKVRTEDSSGNLVNLTSVKAISGGIYHTCALHQDTTVSCWGINSHPHTNQGPECSNTATSRFRGIYNGNCAGKILVSETKELNHVIQISSGGSRSCALLNSGTISCWITSLNENYFLNNSSNGYPYLETISTINNSTAIAVGSSHACAVHHDMTVSCWGEGSYGRLGDGIEDTLRSNGFAISRLVADPVKVKKLDKSNSLTNLINVKSISANEFHTCAIHIDESLSCWGLTNYDLNLETDFIPPPSQNSIYNSAQKIIIKNIEQNTVSSFLSVSVGENHRCVIGKIQNKLYCWDINSSGQLGIGSYNYGSITSLRAVIHSDGYELVEVHKVTAGDSHTCAIHGKNNILSCWGNGLMGQLGGSTIRSAINGFASTLDLNSTSRISVGVNFTCAIVGQGRNVRCFGRGDSGQLGNAGFEHQSTPVAVLDSTNTALFDVSTVSAGDKYGCAIHGAGLKISCWGINNSNAISSTSDSSISRAVEIGIDDATSISVGYNHACAVDISGRASCWGDNTYGQLGSSDLTSSDTPVEVTDSKGIIINDFTEVSTGYSHSCAIHRDKTVSCWGLDDGRLGHIGQINSKPSPTPTKVAGITDVDSISIGHSHTCVIWGEEDKVSCWGSNNLLQLGNPDISENSNTPVDVVNEAGSPLLSVAQISAGESTSCAVFKDSRISCWGSGAYGKLLDLNPYSDISYAVVLSSELFYVGLRFDLEGQQISVGENHICLIENNNSLQCWGANYFGEVGRGGFGGGSQTAVYVNF